MQRRGFLKGVGAAIAGVVGIAATKQRTAAKPIPEVTEADLRIDAPLCPPGFMDATCSFNCTELPRRIQVRMSDEYDRLEVPELDAAFNKAFHETSFV